MNTNDTRVVLLELVTILEGEIVDAGGKTPNIHVLTPSGETIVVDIDTDKRAELMETDICPKRSIRASYKYNPATGERSDYKFVEFVEPKRVPDARLAQLIAQETPAWKDIPDAAEWVRGLR